MRFVLQKIKNATLCVDEEIISQVGKGFIVFAGV